MAEKVLEAIREKGLLSESAQEKLTNLFPEETREKLLGMYERYKQLNEEEQHKILDILIGKVKQSVRDEASNTNLYDKLMYIFYYHSYAVFMFALLIVVLILVFFVYKLFKCLSERETKREEKKKMKQMRKKK